MIKYNDFEILSLIKEGNQDALELMFEKYKGLISKKIYKFNLVYEYEDVFQESLMVLYKTISIYDDSHGKSFTRFFEMNLERKFMSIVSQKVRRNEIFSSNELYIFENNHCIDSNSVYYDLYKKEIAKILTKEEFLVYYLREFYYYSVSYIGEKYSFDDKKIYNLLQRAKMKIKNHFSN